MFIIEGTTLRLLKTLQYFFIFVNIFHGWVAACHFMKSKFVFWRNKKVFSHKVFYFVYVFVELNLFEREIKVIAQN